MTGKENNGKLKLPKVIGPNTGPVTLGTTYNKPNRSIAEAVDKAFGREHVPTAEDIKFSPPDSQ